MISCPPSRKTVGSKAPKSNFKNECKFWASNLDIFDFELSSEDMEAIGRLDQGETHINDFNNDSDLTQMFLGLKPWSQE